MFDTKSNVETLKTFSPEMYFKGETQKKLFPLECRLPFKLLNNQYLG